MPLVSVLIPCFNAARFVRKAIESALNQNYPSKEVIVVDDGSTDDSLAIIKSFGNSIKWETGPNRGGNAARQRLLELSRGEWLQYLDADDYLLPNKISQQLIECENRDADVLWSPSVYEYWDGDRVVSNVTQNLCEENPWIALIRWRLPQTGAALWRRKALEAVGGWTIGQPRCQEHELYERLLEAQRSFVFCPSALSVYRQWSLDTVCRKDPVATMKTRLEIVARAEEYLKKQEKLDENLRQEFFATRIQCARSVYPINRQVAIEMATRFNSTDRSISLPQEPWFPFFYRLAFRFLGFDAAEKIAWLRRSVKRQGGVPGVTSQ